MHGFVVSDDVFKSREVGELHLDLIESGVDQVCDQICKLAWIKHLRHFNVCLSEACESLSAFLKVSDFEKQGKLLTFTDFEMTDLLIEGSEKVLAFRKLEFYRLPIVSNQKVLHSFECIHEDTV